ncbi:MAG TPA: hypothetical protein VJ694_00565 [Patescibacteria group bacterium]|nr:hypothetical protein [Patescibacteria group bacterium]
MKKRAIAFAVLLFLGAGCTRSGAVTFEDCIAAGNPVKGSDPRMCYADGKRFVESAMPPSRPSTGAAWTVGETKTLESGIAVTLKAIEDSRCPKDVQCFWAGELAALLSVVPSPGTPAVEVRLGQTTKPKAETAGYALELVSIDEASATLSVTKI